MWPFTKRPIDPEEQRLREAHQRLREAHERNKREAARQKAAAVAACPHTNTVESYFDGVTYCSDCKGEAP